MQVTRGQWPYRLASYGDKLMISDSKLVINCPDIYVHVASHSYFSDLWGPCDLQITSILISKLYSVTQIKFHVHAVSNSYFGGLWGHCDLQTASEVTSVIKLEPSGLNNLCFNVFLAFKLLMSQNVPEIQTPIPLLHPRDFAGMSHWLAHVKMSQNLSTYAYSY